jgi:hypothetical protein
MKAFLNKNWEALGGVIIIVIAFYAGKYTTPEKVRVQTVTVEKEVVKVEHKRVVIKQNKDGSKETVIVVDTDVKEKSKDQETIKEKTIQSKFNVSLLAGGSLPLTSPVFGVSAQKNFIGPITLGAWVLNNGTGGLSVGLNF